MYQQHRMLCEQCLEISVCIRGWDIGKGHGTAVLIVTQDNEGATYSWDTELDEVTSN